MYVFTEEKDCLPFDCTIVNISKNQLWQTICYKQKYFKKTNICFIYGNNYEHDVVPVKDHCDGTEK